MLSYSRNSYDPRASQQTNEEDQRFAQKIEMLKRAFDEIDLNGNDSLSQHELLTYLDIKAKGQFSRDIAEELYEQMDKDHDGKITVNEFVRVFLEADIILRKKIQAARGYQETYKQRIRECLEKAEEAHHTEEVNAYGISQNSIVSAIIMETRPEGDIAPAAIMNCFLEASLDGQQSFRTEVFRDMSSYPYWDDKFTFQVSSPESILNFMLCQETPHGDEPLGNTSVALHQLTDQSLIETWINLNTRARTGNDLELHVKLQWIHSKEQYYTMEAHKYEENYQKEEEEIIEYEKYLDQLNEPFQGLNVAAHIKHPEPQHYPEPLPQIQDMPVDLQHKRPDKHFSFNEATNSQVQMQKPDRMETDPRVNNRNLERSIDHPQRNQDITSEEIDTRLEVLMNKAAFLLVNKSNPNEWFWKRLALIFCLVEIVISTLITFDRPAFLDLILPILVILYIEYGVLKETISLKYIALAILVSIVLYDFLWLLIYSGVWASEYSKESTLESGSRSFVVFFTYINLIVKLVWGLLCYMAGVKSTKQNTVSLAALH